MSLMLVDTGQQEVLARVLYGHGGAITSSTNASPIVVTTTAAHGLSGNERIVITDHLVNTNANGAQTVLASAPAPTSTTFGLSGTTGNGVGAATGFWSLAGMEALSFHLYKASHTPAESDSVGSYTECTFTGYSAQTLNAKMSTSAGWTAPALVAGGTGSWLGGYKTNAAESTYPQQSWTCSASPDTVYGYYVTGAISTTLYWAEAFASSVVLIAGAIIQVTPRFGMS